MHNRSFEVYILCGGKRLPEYKVKFEDEKTTTCYIPSEAGKEFKICWKSSMNRDTVRVRSTLDGRYMGGNPCSPGESGHRWGVRKTISSRQPFQFASIILSEDENIVTSEQTLQNLGSIEIELIRVHPTTRHAEFRATAVSDIGPVNERAKKAGSHCVSLGQAAPCTPSVKVACRPLYPAEGTWAKFVFRYRPRAILQAQGIIPPGTQSQPLAGPSNVKREASTMTARSRSSVKRKRESELPTSPAPSASASVASARRTPTHALRPPSSIKDSTPKFSDIMPPPSSTSSSHAQSVTKHSSNFQQGKGKSTTPLKSGNKPSPSPSRKKARTDTTAVSRPSSSTKLGSNAHEHGSGPPGPSSDDEVIDLTEIKREGSPIRVNFTNGQTIIDLTLESDSD